MEESEVEKLKKVVDEQSAVIAKYKDQFDKIDQLTSKLWVN